MTDSDPPAVNPYAPSVTESPLVLPGAAGIPLGDRQIPFAGALRPAEVSRALGSGPAFKWYMVFATLLVLQLSWMITAEVVQAGMLRFLLLVYLVPIVMIALVLWLQSARFRTRQTLKRHPRMLCETRGSISSRRIYAESEHGWADLSWESIVGIKLRHDLIVLALNPQLATLIILPKRMFAAEDWDALHAAVAQLAPRLPFGPRSMRLGNAAWMASGDLEPLREVADGAIRLSGVLTLGEVLRSRHGLRIFANLIVLTVIVGAVFGGLYWLLAGLGDSSWFMLLVLLPPALLLLRLGRLVWAAVGGAVQPLLKYSAAVADEGVWMSTPRGTSFSRWSAFGDAILGDRLILLRETPHSISLTPLSRASLVDNSEWQPLVHLVASKVTHP